MEFVWDLPILNGTFVMPYLQDFSGASIRLLMSEERGHVLYQWLWWVCGLRMHLSFDCQESFLNMRFPSLHVGALGLGWGYVVFWHHYVKRCPNYMCSGNSSTVVKGNMPLNADSIFILLPAISSIPQKEDKLNPSCLALSTTYILEEMPLASFASSVLCHEKLESGWECCRQR